jgi:hypothetical protein
MRRTPATSRNRPRECPFTGREWQSVVNAGFGLVDATARENDPRYRPALRQMRRVIARLRAKYGRHPVLLETLADFEDDVAKRLRLYREAIDRATRLTFPTFSIRASLASLLLDEGRSAREARDQLEACAKEVRRRDDSYERKEHAQLLRRATLAMARKRVPNKRLQRPGSAGR